MANSGIFPIMCMTYVPLSDHYKDWYSVLRGTVLCSTLLGSVCSVLYSTLLCVLCVLCSTLLCVLCSTLQGSAVRCVGALRGD